MSGEIQQPLGRDELKENFFYFVNTPTRWGDCDPYGHVNNAVYYQYIEAAAMRFLVVENKLDVTGGEFLAFTVENMCRYHRPIIFPDTVECGMRVAHVGNSSVRYEFGLFTDNEPLAAATAYVVDVYVDPLSETPVTIPEQVRSMLLSISH